MPKDKQSKGQQRREKGRLRAILQGFGLNPAVFMPIINRAVRRQWSAEEFEARIYRSKPFREAFPGILRGDGSLKMSASEYRSMADQYLKISNQFGVALDKARIGNLIAGDVSPQEWFERASIVKAVNMSESSRQAFNEILVASGEQPIGVRDWYDVLREKAAPDLTEKYEAALIRTSGLAISAQEAVAVAGQIGSYGELTNVSELAAQVRQIKGFVQPELVAAGVSDADLLVLEGGGDPKNQRFALERIVRSRRALEQTGARVTPQRTAPGRVALFGTTGESA